MRQAGYFSEEPKNKEMVFVRPINSSASGYPRFHAFVSPGSRNLTNNNLRSKSNFHYRVSRETIIINLHLDQKKPVYRGTPAHAAEYEGPLLEKEASRLKQIVV